MNSQQSQRLENYRLNVQYYGRFTHHGGCLVVLAALLTFFVELARLVHISKYHRHDSSWVVEDDPQPDQGQLAKISKYIRRGHLQVNDELKTQLS